MNPLPRIPMRKSLFSGNGGWICRSIMPFLFKLMDSITQVFLEEDMGPSVTETLTKW